LAGAAADLHYHVAAVRGCSARSVVNYHGRLRDVTWVVVVFYRSSARWRFISLPSTRPASPGLGQSMPAAQQRPMGEVCRPRRRLAGPAAAAATSAAVNRSPNRVTWCKFLPLIPVEVAECGLSTMSDVRDFYLYNWWAQLAPSKKQKVYMQNCYHSRKGKERMERVRKKEKEE